MDAELVVRSGRTRCHDAHPELVHNMHQYAPNGVCQDIRQWRQQLTTNPTFTAAAVVQTITAPTAPTPTRNPTPRRLFRSAAGLARYKQLHLVGMRQPVQVAAAGYANAPDGIESYQTVTGWCRQLQDPLREQCGTMIDVEHLAEKMQLQPPNLHLMYVAMLQSH